MVQIVRSIHVIIFFVLSKQGKNEPAEDEKAEGYIGFVKVGHKNFFFSLKLG